MRRVVRSDSFEMRDDPWKGYRTKNRPISVVERDRRWVRGAGRWSVDKGGGWDGARRPTSSSRACSVTDAAQTRTSEADAVCEPEIGYESVMTKASSAQERFERAVDQTMERVGREFAAAGDRMGRDLQETLTDTDRRLKQQAETLDRALGEELEKALGTTGRNLGGMSEQFVTDYAPLTKQLRALIETARAANEPRRTRSG